MRLAPGRVLVRAIQTSETLAGGRVILTPNVRETWTLGQAEVLAVGPLARCRDEDCPRPHRQGRHIRHTGVRRGAWILCKPRQFVEVEDGWLVNEEAIVGVFQ